MRTVLCSLFSVVVLAQGLTKIQERKYHPPTPTPSFEGREQAYAQRKKLETISALRGISFRSVGPLSQGGRIVGLQVNPQNSQRWMAAFATGGLWLTYNDGATWTSLFDHEEVGVIGAIAARWSPQGDPIEIWVGTGEPNASRSSYAGSGLYRTLDQGKTWQRMGLQQSHRIAKVVLHPSDPKILYVAAQGPLYSDGGERGVYQSTDGGKTWKLSLSGPLRTGATDLLMDTTNPNILYATLWEKDRKPWNFLESGSQSGVFKTIDAGKTWNILTEGLPVGDGMGRMGLAQSQQNPSTLYLFIDNQNSKSTAEQDVADPQVLTAKKIRSMTREEFLKLDSKNLQDFIRSNDFDSNLKAEAVLDDVKKGTLEPKDLLAALNDANASLFETQIKGAELYKSTNGGTTWFKSHTQSLDGLVFTYGYYFGTLTVDPSNDQNVYLLGVPVIKSVDGGKTFKGSNGNDGNVPHSDHHALWIDPQNSQRMILGNDGGLNISSDGGNNWREITNLPVGQFYSIEVDQADPYQIYGGLQDNGVMTGPAKTLRPNQSVDAWKAIWGGDGGWVQVNPKDNQTIYTESQFGFLGRLKGVERKNIRPHAALKQPPYRFNWLTPIEMSSHSPDIIYVGTQKVLRSLDRGDSWTEISPDLTTQATYGDVPFGTLTSISESPQRLGLIYAGSDDGLVHVTRDGGKAWSNISSGLPKNRWVSRVEASPTTEGTVYVTLTAYRNDASEAHIYQSTNFGTTWKSLRGNLPNENFNVIREDAANPLHLYAGSDAGIWMSMNGGLTWSTLGTGLPRVPVHDLIIQSRTRDLVVGTHGRSVYVAPIGILQTFTEAIQEKPFHLFEVNKIYARPWWATDRPTWSLPLEEDPLELWFHTKKSSMVNIRITHADGKVLREWTKQSDAGLNQIAWDYLITPPSSGKGRPFILPGSYQLRLEVDGMVSTTPLVVVAPPGETGNFRRRGGP